MYDTLLFIISYLPTFVININQTEVNIPCMDPMGIDRHFGTKFPFFWGGEITLVEKLEQQILHPPIRPGKMHSVDLHLGSLDLRNGLKVFENSSHAQFLH